MSWKTIVKKFVKKRAAVTGGTRGIGFAIAKKLHENGHEVLVTGTDKNSDVGNDFLYRCADFSTLAGINTFAHYLQTYAPDILVNNAGINMISAFEEISLESFLKIQQVNVIAPFCLCQAVLAHMKRNQWGRIINITSIWSKISKIGRASYSASKFGLDGMTTALAAEVAENGILVNCVSPGFTLTDMTKSILGEEGIKKIENDIPMKRLGEPKEIAAFVAWLASEENTYMSGQNCVIDGGFTRV